MVVDTAMVPSLTEPEGVTSSAFLRRRCEEAGLKGLGNTVLIGKLWAETGFPRRRSTAPSRRWLARSLEKLEQNRQAIKSGINA